MKKLLTILLAIIIATSLCACAASDTTILQFLDNVTSSESLDVHVLARCEKSDNFAPLVIEHLQNSVNMNRYSSAFVLITKLQENGYSEKVVIDAFENIILDKFDCLFKENDYEEAFRLLRTIQENGYYEKEVTDTFERLVLEALDTFIEKGDYSTFFSFLQTLSSGTRWYSGYKSDTLRSLTLDKLAIVRDQFFSSDNVSDMIKYFELIKEYQEDNYYISIITCFPYEDLKHFIELNGTDIILEDGMGGYYDNLHSKHKNESYRYDPLSGMKWNSGSVGRYHYEEKYDFYGDIIRKTVSNYWYGTSNSDSNNSYDEYWYYQGHFIGNSKRIDLKRLIRENSDQLTVITDGESVMICAVVGSNIHIIQGCEMVTISYK